MKLERTPQKEWEYISRKRNVPESGGFLVLKKGTPEKLCPKKGVRGGRTNDPIPSARNQDAKKKGKGNPLGSDVEKGSSTRGEGKRRDTTKWSPSSPTKERGVGKALSDLWNRSIRRE